MLQRGSHHFVHPIFYEIFFMITIYDILHVLHVGVGQHGGGHVHEGRVVEEGSQVHATRSSHASHSWEHSRESSCNQSEISINIHINQSEIGNVWYRPIRDQHYLVSTNQKSVPGPPTLTPELTLSSAICRFDL